MTIDIHLKVIGIQNERTYIQWLQSVYQTYNLIDRCLIYVSRLLDESIEMFEYQKFNKRRQKVLAEWTTRESLSSYNLLELNRIHIPASAVWLIETQLYVDPPQVIVILLLVYGRRT